MIEGKLFIRKYIFVSCFIILISLSLILLSPESSFGQPLNPEDKLSKIVQANNETVNSNVSEISSQFTPARLIKVLPSVYTAVGYGPSNIIMIEGTDGLVILDSGSSVDQATKVLSEFRKITDKPIAALVYTNGKVSSVGGGGVFVNDSKQQGHNIDIIANTQFVENVFPSIGQIAKQKSLYELYWNGLLLPRVHETNLSATSGIGANFKLGNISFVPPTTLFNETLETSYSGINMTLFSAPGPSPEQVFVWLPEQNVIFSGDLVYQSFPNLYSMSGIEDVDIPAWIDAIDTMIDKNSTYLVPSHLLPVSGNENVSDILISYRDGISYLVQQTVRYINQGYDANEIAEILELPPYLKDHPWLQERLGQLSWATKQIYNYIVGWNSGDATWFNPISLKERGSKIVNGFGGLNATLDEVKRSLDKNEYSWAAELSTYILYGYPDNNEAKSLKADALRKLGLENPTSGGRNWYLTQANILDGKINSSTLQSLPRTNIADEVLSVISIDDLLFNMLFKLDPSKSPEEDLTLGIYLNDTGEGFTLEIRNDVVDYKTSFPEIYNIALFADSNTLKDILVGKKKLLDGIIEKKVTIDGDFRDFSKFVGSFDQKFVIPVYRSAS